jgi:hypothetical protein
MIIFVSWLFVRIHFNISSLSIQKKVDLEDKAMALFKALKEYAKQQKKKRNQIGEIWMSTKTWNFKVTLNWAIYVFIFDHLILQ